MPERLTFPNRFRQHRAKAEALLASGVDADVIYACLELRMCLEAYAYWQLSHYIKQASFDLVQRTWQPTKVIKELRAIDPMVTESFSVFFHREGKPEARKKLGDDVRLGHKAFERHHALGNYLHFPMLKDERSGPDIDTARRVAQEVAADLAKVFPPGWVSAHFNPPMHEFQCRKCGSPIARKIGSLKAGNVIECSGCSHQWEAVINDDGQLELEYIVFDWQCRCGSTQEIQHHQVVHGKQITCTDCDTAGTIITKTNFTVIYPADEPPAAAPA